MGCALPFNQLRGLTALCVPSAGLERAGFWHGRMLLTPIRPTAFPRNEGRSRTMVLREVRSRPPGPTFPNPVPD